MSTQIIHKSYSTGNRTYSLTATRFSGGKKGLMCQLTVDDGATVMYVQFPKDDIIEICKEIINSMEEFD